MGRHEVFEKTRAARTNGGLTGMIHNLELYELPGFYRVTNSLEILRDDPGQSVLTCSVPLYWKCRGNGMPPQGIPFQIDAEDGISFRQMPGGWHCRTGERGDQEDCISVLTEVCRRISRGQQMCHEACCPVKVHLVSSRIKSSNNG